MLVFDIETEPLDGVADMFDASDVKVGNLKDKAKIDLKVLEARQAFIDNAALSPTTGRIVAIGLYNDVQDNFICRGIVDPAKKDGGERELLEAFWTSFRTCRSNRTPMVGLNIFDFDLPFIVTRSWLLGVSVPEEARAGYRYWDPIFIDLRLLWLCGRQPGQCRSNFSELARAFGTAGKSEGLDGSRFAELWWTNRDRAIKYLAEDVRQPAVWADRMGIV